MALTACRALTPSPLVFVLLTSFVPFALPGYLVSAAGWLVAGRGLTGELRRWGRLLLAVSLAGALVQLALWAPAYVGGHPRGPADLTVVELNTRLGGVDAAQLVDLVRDSHADVVVLTEVTDHGLDAMERSGLSRWLPHRAGRTGRVASGTMVWSRYPLTHVVQLPVRNGGWQMRVEARRPFWLVAAHTTPPDHRLDLWRLDFGALRSVVRSFDGPLVLAGDLNATLDHRPLRRLRGEGLQDAARQSNAGWQPTWPSDPGSYRGLPFALGLLTLDHVLVRDGLGAVSTQTHVIDGSDHRALVARLRFT